VHIRLQEGIPIKDLITILEAIGDWGGTVKDPDQLTEYVRQALWRQITKMYEINGEIIAISLDPQTEEKILEGIEEKEGVIKIKIPPPVRTEAHKFNKREHTKICKV
jgi:flagellar biosynthesis protein FlhA